VLRRVNSDMRVRLIGPVEGVEVRVVKPLWELMGPVLGRVSADTGSIRALEPVWRQAVGELASKHTRPARLEGRALVVVCDGPAWRDVLVQEQAAVLARLHAALGAPTVARLVFEVE